MQQTSLHSWIILGTTVIAAAIAVFIYRKMKNKVHDPKLHVVSRAGDTMIGPSQPVYVLNNGVIYKRGNIIGYMRDGDSVLIAEHGSIYRLVDGALEFRRALGKELHVRIDSSTGERYALLSGVWRLLHLYEGDRSWDFLNINMRTSFGTNVAD